MNNKKEKENNFKTKKEYFVTSNRVSANHGQPTDQITPKSGKCITIANQVTSLLSFPQVHPRKYYCPHCRAELSGHHLGWVPVVHACNPRSQR
jgi:hypothetical protein